MYDIYVFKVCIFVPQLHCKVHEGSLMSDVCHTTIKTKDNKCWQVCGEKRTLVYCLWDINVYSY